MSDKEFKIAYDYFPLEASKCGTIRNSETGYVYTLSDDGKGYHRISTSYNGKDFHAAAHRVVGIAWIDNPDNLPVINHINGIKTDNRVENLEWCTHKENTQHAIATGLITHKVGEECGSSKYSEATVREVCQLLVEGWRGCDIAKSLDVHHGFVSDVKSGKSWSHVSCEYWDERISRGSLKEPVVREICQMMQDGHTVKAIAEHFNSKNVTVSKIRHIRNGAVYTDISKDYTWKQNASKNRPGRSG